MLAARVWCLLAGLAAVRQALERTAGPDTLVLLGVTRTDTGPAFFDALDKAREGRSRALQTVLVLSVFPSSRKICKQLNTYQHQVFSGRQAFCFLVRVFFLGSYVYVFVLGVLRA